MQFPHFFIRRPIFASVIWIIVLILGGLSYFNLAVENYPEVAPPTVVVSASYPGADAETVANTIASPLEQEINGVEGMLYMSSQSSNDGSLSITVTFKLGTDLDIAQVQVQNRVAIASARLPDEARRRGITTRKNSPDLMMVINLYSPDNRYGPLYLANYASLQLNDALSRIGGVGDVRIFGGSEYAMRIWIDPDRLSSMGLTADDVVSALQAQNIQVASGTLDQQPTKQQEAFEINVQTKGRLTDPDEFANIVIHTAQNGRLIHIKDIGQVELGADTYATYGYLDKEQTVAIPIFQRPGTNALETADQIRSLMKEKAEHFPAGLDYKIVYDPTRFVEESITAVYHTIFEAVFLVVLVILLFLQNWRAAIIPIVAIPLSLIGTFIFMEAFGFSLNNLTLFGLVLAVGIVVDDAIVVIENMERLMSQGLKRKEAAFKTMDEVGGALIGIGLVLTAVFIPTLFISGLPGEFFKQFGVVIVIATVLSVAISLTLSPTLAAIVLQQKEHKEKPAERHTLAFFLHHPFMWISHNFGDFLETFSTRYAHFVAWSTARGKMMIAVYVVLIALTGLQFYRVPEGFIPQQDEGYFIVGIQLPPGASLDRTNKIVKNVVDKILDVDGVGNTVAFVGFSGATFGQASNGGAIFPALESFEERRAKGIAYSTLFANLTKAVAQVEGAQIVVIPPPPVRGIGHGGGFKLMVQDKAGLGHKALYDATMMLAMAANQSPTATQVFSFYEISTPQLFLNLERERADILNIPLTNVFSALSTYIGSAYVNDFNAFGRTFRVIAQANAPNRMQADDVERIKVRSNSGAMVPLGSLGRVEDRASTSRQPRYNLFPAAELQGSSPPGIATGDTLNALETLAQKILPEGLGFEWTEISYLQKNAGSSGTIAFVLAVLFVFLLLAALYESWILPLAIILIVPMCLLSAMTGISFSGRDNNLISQIGLIVLVGLACKNAILIVEFAKDNELAGSSPIKAAIDAARVRLRPILMTSVAFILGVVPLVFAKGAGAEMRQAIGITVFSGMLGVTFFGLVFTPIFYVLCRSLGNFLKHTFYKQKQPH